MINAAEMILRECICPLSSVFKKNFENVTYTAVAAKRRLLQMPVVTLRIEEPSSGNSKWYTMEFIKGLDYHKLIQFLSTQWKHLTTSQNISRADIKQLLSLAHGDRERECLRYAIYKTSGLSQTGARRHFGFERMKERSERVQDCIDSVKEIRLACDKLACAQVSCILKSESSDEEWSDSDEFRTACSQPTLNSFEH